MIKIKIDRIPRIVRFPREAGSAAVIIDVHELIGQLMQTKLAERLIERFDLGVSSLTGDRDLNLHIEFGEEETDA